MTDKELADYLGLKLSEFNRIKARYPQLIERYLKVALKFKEVEAYDRGEGPRPKGVIICE